MLTSRRSPIYLGVIVAAVLLLPGTAAPDVPSPAATRAITHSTAYRASTSRPRHVTTQTASHHAAQASSASQPDFGVFGWAFTLLVILLGVLFWFGKASPAARERQRVAAAAAQQSAQQAQEEHEHEVRAFSDAPLLPVSPNALVLQAGETCYWQESAQLAELQTRTHFEGGSLGVSVRIARGVYLRPSRFAGAPVSQTSMQIDDTGSVFVTNTRVVFIGARGAKSITLKQLAGLETFSDGVRLTPANKKPVAIMTGNFKLGVIIERATRGAFGGTVASATSATMSLSAAQANLTVLESLLHQALDPLKAQYDVPDTNAPPASGELVSLAWVRRAAAQLEALGKFLQPDIAALSRAFHLEDATAATTQMHAAVDTIQTHCEQLVEWERAVCTARPEPKFSRLISLLKGSSAPFFDAYQQLPIEFGKLQTALKAGGSYSISLKPTADYSALLAEIDRLRP